MQLMMSESGKFAVLNQAAQQAPARPYETGFQLCPAATCTL